MAFKVWSENGNNFPATGDFDSSSGERGNGFQSGVAAHSSYVNAALKQDSLFTSAFMDLINDRGSSGAEDANFESTKDAIKSLINSQLPIKLYKHYFVLTLEQSKPPIMFDVISSNPYCIIGANGNTNTSMTSSYTTTINDRLVTAILNKESITVNGCVRLKAWNATQYKNYYPVNFKGENVGSLFGYTGKALKITIYELISNPTSSYTTLSNNLIYAYGNDSSSHMDPGGTQTNIIPTQPYQISETVTELGA